MKLIPIGEFRKSLAYLLFSQIMRLRLRMLFVATPAHNAVFQDSRIADHQCVTMVLGGPSAARIRA
jgi:hypothetical protein